MPATAPILITVDETRKTLTASGPFALRAAETVLCVPAAPVAGSCTLTLSRASVALAEATLTNGAGTIDLSTDAAISLFTLAASTARLAVDVDLWHNTENRLLAKGRATLVNNPDTARVILHVGAAGELSMTLAATLAAGTPVMRDAAGKAAGCLAADAHRLVGILRTGGAANAAATVTTAGIVSVTGWALSPGLFYYLSRTAAMLTSTPPDGYNVRPVGIAIDASTLALIPQPTVQTLASGPHYLTWDSPYRRFIAASAPSESAGSADAGRIPCLGADGKLHASMMPDATAASVAAVRALFASHQTLSNPTDAELLAAVNALITTLKGA